MEQANLYFAWTWMLLGGLSGAMVGLFFHDAEWLGGYASWRRRMIRLGHIAFFGTGLINLGFALSVPALGITGGMLHAASVLLIVGAATMPAVCYAAAWRDGMRHLFFVPVLSLIGGVAALLLGGLWGGG